MARKTAARRESGTSGTAGTSPPETWLRVPAEAELPQAVRDLHAAPIAKLGFVPNVLRFFALRPAHLLAWNEHYDELMRGESGLTKAEREMIAVVVSVTNRCSYCVASHSAALRKLLGDEGLADQIAADHRAAAITDRMKAALEYARKLTEAVGAAEESDVQRLRDLGWTDEEIMDIVEVTAMFNFTNRLASGLGWQPNPEYETLGRFPADER